MSDYIIPLHNSSDAGNTCPKEESESHQGITN